MPDAAKDRFDREKRERRIVSLDSARQVVRPSGDHEAHKYHCGLCGAPLGCKDLGTHGCASTALQPQRYAELFWEEA